VRRLVTAFALFVLLLAMSPIVTARDASADREKERRRVLAQHLEADAVVAESVQKLSEGKPLDPMAKARLERAVREVQQTAQTYRRIAW
jgi:hypothetical protein